MPTISGWVKIGDNLYRNVSKRMAPNAIDSLWSAKFAKSVTGAGAPWNTVLGHELEHPGSRRRELLGRGQAAGLTRDGPGLHLLP